MTTIALGIPTTADWVPERAVSLHNLLHGLGFGLPPLTVSELRKQGAWTLENAKSGEVEAWCKLFTERAPNWKWSVDLWTWGHDTGADWLLQLQDDVMVAPRFWPALRAMLAGAPSEASIIGLSAVHPAALEMARRGHRWYRTSGMLVGWAYAIRRDALGAFLSEREGITAAVGKECEDVLLGTFAAASKRTVYHPNPTICDHDTTIPSSYANDHHSTRRPQCTWRDYPEGSLTDPTWWKPSGTPELLAMPPQRVCWSEGCGRGIAVQWPGGFGVCGVCFGGAMGQVMGHMMQGGRP